MLQLKNDTSFQSAILLSPDPDGVETLYVAVKATFDLRDEPVVSGTQLPVTLSDVYHGDPQRSSIKVPLDIALEKPGTDVLLVGSAYAPGGRPTSQMDVSFRIGPVGKTVRVFGDRVWRSATLGYSPSRPRPFEVMPLVWERAFGGMDRVGSLPVAAPFNPVGTGFFAPRGERVVDGAPLPNLEDPQHLITSPGQVPPPACFASIAPHWEPRRSFAGTYDERWQRDRAPYLPDNFDTRFFQLAPPALNVSGYLKGGEAVEIIGATPSGSLRFRLPDTAIRVEFLIDGELRDRPVMLDTVLIEPDRARLSQVWRSSLRCDKTPLRVREIRVALEPHDADAL